MTTSLCLLFLVVSTVNSFQYVASDLKKKIFANHKMNTPINEWKSLRLHTESSTGACLHGKVCSFFCLWTSKRNIYLRAVHSLISLPSWNMYLYFPSIEKNATTGLEPIIIGYNTVSWPSVFLFSLHVCLFFFRHNWLFCPWWNSIQQPCI